MEMKHKGWDWEQVDSKTWDRVSEEFFPVAFAWKEKFHSVLDIGAGKGRHALFFAEHGFDVSAVDLSESSVAYIKGIARERDCEVDAVVADMTRLPYEDNRFDCVVCFHTIYHTDYEGIKKALGEIGRVLKDRGEAYITFNSKENPHFVLSDSLDGYTMIKQEGLEQGIPHCFVDANDLFALLSDFDIISMNKIQNYVRRGKGTHGIHYFVHIRVKGEKDF